tara:strand:- start:4927 stop:5424 length:498 start_codon:yes stop_codon:yes gene_type:complete
MSELDQDFYRIATSFRRPIPGQSLTNSPENQYPWEQPPVLTDPQDASRFFLSKLTEPSVYNAVLDAIEEGIPLMDLAQVLMYQAYRDGLINPDLMMILVEQVVYMMAALAERQGIDFIIQEDDEEDIEEERQTALLAESMPNEITTQLDETELPPRQTSSLLGAN